MDNRKWAPILFTTEDWATIDFLKPADSRTTRIYYCACFCCSESHSMPLDGSNDHLIYGASYSTAWHCNGHPPLTFPTEIYGVPLAKSEDVGKAVLAVMEHRVVIQDPIPDNEVDPEAFLIHRLYTGLKRNNSKARIDALIIAFLSHNDSLYRSVACKNLEKFPAPGAAEELVNAYRKQPDLFDGILHPHHSRGTTPYLKLRLIGLDHQFQKALLANLKFSKSKDARDLAREYILSGKMKAAWGAYEKEIGTRWVGKHLCEIYTADPKHAIFSLLAYGKVEETSKYLQRTQQLQNLNLLPAKEFLDALPSSIRKALEARH